MTTPPAAPTSGDQPPPPPPPSGPGVRQLRRRPDEGHLGGVCAGLAEYFGVDPVVVRIAAVALAIAGPGVPAYVLAWIFVPEAGDAGSSPLANRGDLAQRAPQIIGIVLLVLAVTVLWGDWWAPARHIVLPMALIGVGLWLLLRDGEASGRPAPAPAAPPTTAPMASTPPPWEPTDPVQSDITVADEPMLPRSEPLTSPFGTGAMPETLAGLTTVTPTPSAEPPERPDEGSHRRHLLAPLVMGALLVWAGVAWITGVSVQTGLAVALCIVGIGFVLGAFMGGAWALVPAAVLLTGALVVATMFDIPLRGPVGERTWVPASVSEIDSPYELSIGSGTLDLTELDLRDRGEVAMAASVGIGELVVLVPDDAAVQVTADVSGGEAQIAGRSDSGMSVSTTRSLPGEPGGGRLDLDLEVGLGSLRVVPLASGTADAADQASTARATRSVPNAVRIAR